MCGKTPETAALQDLVVHAVKGISQYAHRAAQLGKRDPEVDRFVIEALFATVTMSILIRPAFSSICSSAVDVRERARTLYERLASKAGSHPSNSTARQVEPADSRRRPDQPGAAVSIPTDRGQGEDVTGLQELILYGLKGAAPTWTTHWCWARRPRGVCHHP